MKGSTASLQKNISKKRLAIFASYDGNCIVNDYVVYYLNELNKVSDIIFVADNSLNETEQEKIRPLAICIIAEHHGEYDFGSYKRGYIWAEKNNILSNYDQLIFCNDSVFGPFHSLEPILSEMKEKEEIDFWGMFMVETKNIAGNNIRKKPHAQSYFIVFNHNVATSAVLKNFMHSITKLKNKNAVIEEYEIGLSQKLICEGFLCGSYMSASSNAPHRKDALAIVKQGFPFLKISLFKAACLTKKSWCYNLWKYKSIIAEVAPNYPLYSIENYLKRNIGEKELNKQLFKLRFRIPPISRFLFYRKVTKSGRLIVKFFSVTIYIRKKLN